MTSDYWEYVGASLSISNCIFLLFQQKAKDGNQWASSQGGAQARNNNTGGNAKKKKKQRAARRNKYMKKLIQKSVWNHEPSHEDPWSCNMLLFREAEEHWFLTGNVVKSLKCSIWSTFSWLYLLYSTIFLYFWSAVAMAAIKHWFLYMFIVVLCYVLGKIRLELAFNWKLSEVWGRVCPSVTIGCAPNLLQRL